MGVVTMGRGLQIAFFAIALCSAIGGQAYSESNQFSCSGDDIEPVGLAKSPTTAQLLFVSPKGISFDLGKGNVKPTITSDNKIALDSTPQILMVSFSNIPTIYSLFITRGISGSFCAPRKQL